MVGVIWYNGIIEIGGRRMKYTGHLIQFFTFVEDGRGPPRGKPEKSRLQTYPYSPYCRTARIAALSLASHCFLHKIEHPILEEQRIEMQFLAG